MRGGGEVRTVHEQDTEKRERGERGSPSSVTCFIIHLSSHPHPSYDRRVRFTVCRKVGRKTAAAGGTTSQEKEGKEAAGAKRRSQREMIRDGRRRQGKGMMNSWQREMKSTTRRMCVVPLSASAVSCMCIMSRGTVRSRNSLFFCSCLCFCPAACWWCKK